MTIAGALTANERMLVDALTDAGVPISAATMTATTLTRRFVRPEVELLDLLSNYPHLESERARNGALAYMRKNNWLIDISTARGAAPLVRASPDLADELDRILPHLAPISSLIPHADSVKVLGHMGDTQVYDTFATLLATARSDIALPMIMTSPKLAAVETLIDRARAGVTVRILLATPGLAADIRGQSSLQTARDRAKIWRSHAKKSRNLHVRVTRRRANLRGASSALVDHRILRYDVYDDVTQRSTDGIMIEVDTFNASNLARMYSEHFDDAWDHSRPLGFWPTVTWTLCRWWWVPAIVTSGLFIATHYTQDPFVVSLVAGAVIGYAVDHLDNIGKFLARWWGRIRS